MIVRFSFSKTRQIVTFWHFQWTFVHLKCKRSSLRSQCWMRLFLCFSDFLEWFFVWDWGWCDKRPWFSWSGFNWQWLVYQATNHNLITLSWLEASSNLITGREQRRTLKIDPLQHLNGSSDKSFLSNLSIRSLAFLVNFLAVAKCICVIKALKWTLIYWTLFGQSVDHITWLLIRWQLYQNSFRD